MWTNPTWLRKKFNTDQEFFRPASRMWDTSKRIFHRPHGCQQLSWDSIILIKIVNLDTWAMLISRNHPTLSLIKKRRSADAIGVVLLKKSFVKISQYSQESNLLKLPFKKVAGRNACNFIKKRPRHRSFPVNIGEFLRTPILKNICARLLLKWL